MPTQKCTFCRNDLLAGRGIMFVKNDGAASYFCNSKCERNAGLGRDPRYVKWTSVFRKGKPVDKKAVAAK